MRVAFTNLDFIVELGRAMVIQDLVFQEGSTCPRSSPVPFKSRTIVFLMCFFDYQEGVVRAKNGVPLVFRKRWSLDVQLATFTCAIPVIEQDT